MKYYWSLKILVIKISTSLFTSYYNHFDVKTKQILKC